MSAVEDIEGMRAAGHAESRYKPYEIFCHPDDLALLTAMHSKPWSRPEPVEWVFADFMRMARDRRKSNKKRHLKKRAMGLFRYAEQLKARP